jgi:hypothetical protein
MIASRRRLPQIRSPLGELCTAGSQEDGTAIAAEADWLLTTNNASATMTVTNNRNAARIADRCLPNRAHRAAPHVRCLSLAASRSASAWSIDVVDDINSIPCSLS